MVCEKLGVDIGGVIIDRANDNTDTSFFSDRYLETTAVPGAFRALQRLVQGRFGSRVYLVSKCGENVQRKTLEWLAHHRFFTETGIWPDHVRFCKERHAKAEICRELEITHFIDDRLEVLAALPSQVASYLFQGRAREIERFRRDLDRVTRVESWEEVLTRLLT